MQQKMDVFIMQLKHLSLVLDLFCVHIELEIYFFDH